MARTWFSQLDAGVVVDMHVRGSEHTYNCPGAKLRPKERHGRAEAITGSAVADNLRTAGLG
jgi:hypothetical protein